MYIGLISMWIGLSSSAGLRPSNIWCPTICITQPMTTSRIVMIQSQTRLTFLAMTSAAISSGIAETTMASPRPKSNAIHTISAGMTSRDAAVT